MPIILGRVSDVAGNPIENLDESHREVQLICDSKGRLKFSPQGTGYDEDEMVQKVAMLIWDTETLSWVRATGGEVDGTNVNVTNFPATQAVSGLNFDIRSLSEVRDTVKVANKPNEKLKVNDTLTGEELLPDQTGGNGVLLFQFSSPVDLVVVYARSANGLLTASASVTVDPSDQLGFPCVDGAPTYIPVGNVSSIKVFAPSGMIVRVCGYRHG